MDHSLLQSTGATKAVYWQGLYWEVCHCLPSSSYHRNLEFGHDVGNTSPILHEGHHGIFSIHQLMLANGPPSLTSIRGITHTLINRLPVKHCDDSLTGLRFKPRPENLEVSVRTSRSRLSYQPV